MRTYARDICSKRANLTARQIAVRSAITVHGMKTATMRAGIVLFVVPGVTLKGRNLYSTKLFLGIDPSITNTGVVLLGTDGKLIGYVNGGDFTKGLKGFERYEAQAEGIVGFIQGLSCSYDCPIVCGYEGYSFNSPHRAFDLAEYGGILKHALRRWLKAETIYLIPPMVNKNFATGHGTASKELMQQAAADECADLLDTSNDICDAYFLAMFAAFVNGVRNSANRKLMRKRISLTLKYKETV